ncbi:LPS assembly protein LptD [Desulfofustis limnaeus]|uniref:LPS-assembly protein LptD n=1 Tax=Desulfofustis limnaeus TaxID=2740163 RepID=A0ABM7WAK5_9BACT|nr:LPS assembly protein LptD [Desulfofustis limnaeus]BDD88017.1 LPS-assembly protein LptD [Desulfofustis limnaeus]
MIKNLPGIVRSSVVFLSAMLLFVPGPSNLSAAESVATEEWDITADKLTRFDQPASIVAEGNIVLVKRKQLPPPSPTVRSESSDWSTLLEEEPEPTEITPADLEEEGEPHYRTEITITADWAVYDIALNTIKARGNVSVITDDEQLYADQGEVNLEQETGVFKQATIIRKEHDLHLEGEVVEKTGFKTYHIQNGWVITCKVEADETAPWSFAASDAVIEQDGYAVLKHARFRVKDVPLLYSPWLMIPAKSKRETGFLLPELLSSENSGFGFNLPFFWNISDSTDLTVYTQYYSDRGYMPGLEFRYVKSETDRGLFMGNYLHDELSDESETAYYADTEFTHDNQDRYWFRGKADQDFANGWMTRLDVDIVSDRDYLTEFNTGMTGFTKTNEKFLGSFGRSLESKTEDQRTNTLGVQKAWGSTSLAAELLAINDVRDNTSGNSPLWNLPSVDYTGTLPLETFGDITLSWDSSYYNFWREEGVGGHRVDLYPRLSAPVPLSQYLESRAEIGLRDTFYVVQEYGDAEWTEDTTQNRALFDFNAEVGTTLMRAFPLEGEAGRSLNHQIRPFVEYGFVPDIDQDDLPRFDGIDRIGEENGITYGIDNFFNLFDGEMEDREFAYASISQSYSLLDDDSDEPFSAVNLQVRFQPIERLFFDYRTDFDVYGEGFVRHFFETYYSNDRGDFFELEYYFDDGSNDEQINGMLSTYLAANWRTELSFEHSISEGETNEADFALIYQALCWSVEFATQYTRTDTAFMVVFSLANIGSELGFSY